MYIISLHILFGVQNPTIIIMVIFVRGNMENITLSVPTWFCALFSIGFIAFLIYIGGLFQKVKDICKEFPLIKTALTRISEILLQKGFSKESVYLQSNSPVSLTEKGIEAINKSGFNEFYEENKNIIKNKLDKYKINNMADLEEACKEVMNNIEDSLPKYETLKTFAYNEGIPILELLFACAIALRDIIAKERSMTH